MKKKAKEEAEGEGPIALHVGRKIALLRAARDVTQSQLARESKVKRASISEYEAGLSTPDSSTLERLLHGLKCRWAALDLAEWFLVRFSWEGTLSEAPPSSVSPDALEEAVTLLRGVSVAEIPEDDGRLVLCVKHNLADNLSKLDRFDEARALLPEVRSL